MAPPAANQIGYKLFYNGRIHHIFGARIYASSGNQVLVSSDSGATWKLVFLLPVSWTDKFISRMNLLSRAFRAGISHIVATEDFVMVFGFGRIWRYCTSARTVQCVADIVGSRPLAVCNTGQGFYYGVYSSNQERRPVSVIASDASGRIWREVYKFDGVRHIHGVFWDKYSSLLWITTGDEDSEVGIYTADLRFSKVTRIVGGKQQFRAVQLVFVKEYVYFGSDTARECNHLYRFRRADSSVQQLQDTGGSVMWGGVIKDIVCFSTAVEPSPANTSRYADLWMSDSSGANWRIAASFKKDPWHQQVFQYGQIFFPTGDSLDGALLFTPFATNGGMKTYRIEL